ncbi:MAG TPA: FAD-binding oxidoreductase [Intrasporangium sp.]|uniref:FAD-binding oxidoreductase n=1 Tax=Intrasporangium sp. TaxID=1925024 RepID=UPI002D794433|nr:FAD-binding oxidoreductase [Intrasporangium sp.]HET7399954.1 FAD-binding oxidoreductase [Intrasporangium sp.]
MADVLEDLRAATGGNAGPATEADAVDGVPARWVARPRTTEETSAVLRATAAHGLAVVARGAGTKLTWGAAPERADVVLDTTGLDAVVEHAAGDLICVVGAGRALESLQAELGRAGQRLGIDDGRNGTVGGAVATAATGPTRLYHGSVRDLVIGMTLVRPDGVVAHAGGKVVKNVAGYDLGKLLTGSFGTLGVITQVAFRLHPVPAARRWVTTTLDSRARIQQRVLAVTHAQVVPSAVELDWSAGGATLSLLLEGVPPGVERRTSQALDLLGPDAGASEEAPPWWGREPQGEAGVLLKVTHEIAGLSRLLAALETAAAAAGVTPTLRGSPVVGTALVALDGDVTAEGLAAFVTSLRSAQPGFGGSVVVLEAPAAVKQGVDVWGPVGGLDLMKAVKAQFDPERRLAPGRFVGGI